MTLEEAETEIAAAIADLQETVGGDWESDGGAPRSCSSGLVTGTRLSEHRYADGDTDREKVIELVKAHWSNLGYSLSERTDETPAIIDRVFADTGNGGELQFTASDNGMTITALSPCVPD